MPRFFFNIYDGVSMLDDTGTELADWQEARIQAIELAGAVIKDEAKHIALGEDWRIEMTDERKLVLFRFDFITLEAPALSSHRGKEGAS
ncbi:hypothetical protein SAMN02799636_04301 [Methylobacterium sp. 275MFSha3.1]|uniref:DUF6894 family protein n=1 Tax=Methylobacterium sp. 275MFSha3.1 TaxID=1502746 RepID=UPI0008A73EB5|nr:hypothetical protein [Methylobacterium sp. 275MFSha3.1]SEH88937.1 hypothetical protein SAMN02799636_04301 [Methylobacterium sp. 275MFSha3.1]